MSVDWLSFDRDDDAVVQKADRKDDLFYVL